MSTVPTPNRSRRIPLSKKGAGSDVESILIGLAAEQTGFPPSSIDASARLLDDLNLDSIKAAELVGRACKAAGVAGRIDPSGYANTSIAEIAQAIRRVIGDDGRPTPTLSPTPKPTLTWNDTASGPEADGPSWVRCFAIEYVVEAA